MAGSALTTRFGPTGPTGPGPTGPTGPTQTGPTGPEVTGPTGADSVITGPTGIVGPTGPVSGILVEYGTEVDFLGSTGDQSISIEASHKGWLEEVGWVVTELTLDGGSLTTQPTVRFGIVGSLAKYKAAAATTLLTATGKRARYTTLLEDDGETTFSAGMTVAGVITGGGGSEVYKGKPYWVYRILAD